MSNNIHDKKPAEFNSVLWWIGIILLTGFALTMISVIAVAYLNGEYQGGNPDYKGTGSLGGLVFGFLCCGGIPITVVFVLFLLMKRQKKAAVLKKENYYEHQIFYLARSHSGQITITEIVMELSISAEEAKKIMDRLVVKGFCELRIAESGTMVYRFQDFSGDKNNAQPVV